MKTKQMRINRKSLQSHTVINTHGDMSLNIVSIQRNFSLKHA